MSNVNPRREIATFTQQRGSSNSVFECFANFLSEDRNRRIYSPAVSSLTMGA